MEKGRNDTADLSFLQSPPPDGATNGIGKSRTPGRTTIYARKRFNVFREEMKARSQKSTTSGSDGSPSPSVSPRPSTATSVQAAATSPDANVKALPRLPKLSVEAEPRPQSLCSASSASESLNQLMSELAPLAGDQPSPNPGTNENTEQFQKQQQSQLKLPSASSASSLLPKLSYQYSPIKLEAATSPEVLINSSPTKQQSASVQDDESESRSSEDKAEILKAKRLGIRPSIRKNFVQDANSEEDDEDDDDDEDDLSKRLSQAYRKPTSRLSTQSTDSVDANHLSVDIHFMPGNMMSTPESGAAKPKQNRLSATKNALSSMIYKPHRQRKPLPQSTSKNPQPPKSASPQPTTSASTFRVLSAPKRLFTVSAPIPPHLQNQDPAPAPPTKDGKYLI